MKKRTLLTMLFVFVSFVILFAADGDQAAAPDKGIDWFSLIIGGGYLLGVFILLPIVIYTNLKEKLFAANAKNQGEIQPVEGLSEVQKNERAGIILEKIGEKLTPFTAEDGSEKITITNGRQAKFMKQGLDYINTKLCPTDAGVIDRVKELSEVYNNRTKRAFTGSYWIIACSAGVALLFLFAGGISTFLFIHLLGLLFYILSSRTTVYGIEKRMHYFNAISIGIVASIMTALFVGDGTKYYVKEGSGPWKRDWETEGNMAMMRLLFLFIIAMILGLLAALLGVINFIINYSSSFLLPLKSKEDWYEKKFAQVTATV